MLNSRCMPAEGRRCPVLVTWTLTAQTHRLQWWYASHLPYAPVRELAALCARVLSQGFRERAQIVHHLSPAHLARLIIHLHSKNILPEHWWVCLFRFSLFWSLTKTAHLTFAGFTVCFVSSRRLLQHLSHFLDSGAACALNTQYIKVNF